MQPPWKGSLRAKKNLLHLSNFDSSYLGVFTDPVILDKTKTLGLALFSNMSFSDERTKVNHKAKQWAKDF